VSRLGLFVAQGFGTGRCPKAPGTLGTLLGLPWLVVLLLPGSLWLFLLGILAGLALSVWLCGLAEKVLGVTDPGSVVLDEITAFPICLVPLVVSHWLTVGSLPAWQELFAGKGLVMTALCFLAFRVLDITKPWPIRCSQRLPGGWGVTVDDVLAAAGVALVSLILVA
jgi:phosphatidylglycerophosphatase A